MKLPLVQAVKRTIQRAINGIDSAIPLPIYLTDLNLPADYQKAFDGRDFLLFDNISSDYELRIRDMW